MKKPLIALAAVAATSAACAQPNATISGRVEFAYEQTSAAGNKVAVSNPDPPTFKDTEDLGGGLKADFFMKLAYFSYAFRAAVPAWAAAYGQVSKPVTQC